jgi:hypothetical protein
MPPAATRVDTIAKSVHWSGIIAGALAAAALAFVLHSFAAAIGLATSSTTPTWRDGSWALWILSGLYLILVALVSYGLGGYIAGYLRPALETTSTEEAELRDGGHGLAVWAIATILTALLAFGVAQALTRLAAPSAGPSGPASSIGGENIIAYDLDRLFRSPKRPETANLQYARSEASRILLTVSGHDGMSGEDRTYLTQLVAANTGIAPDEASKRVSQVAATAEENIRRARQSSVLLAFMAGAAALLGAAAAWFAACLGGQHRDRGSPMTMQWGWSPPSVRTTSTRTSKP